MKMFMLNGWCLIKIGVVVGIDTWTLLATRNFRCGIELWYQITHP